MVASLRIEVEGDRRVLVDAEHELAVGDLGLEKCEALLSEVTEPGVVGPAFGVVVVGNDHRRDPEPSREDPARRASAVLTDLVDLVHGNRQQPERESRRAGEGDRSAESELLGEETGNEGPCPLAQRISRAARTRRTATAPRPSAR